MILNKEIFETKYSHMKDNPDLAFFHKLNQIRFSILKKYGLNKTCLDLGCGNGIHMIPLLEQGFNVQGLDYSKSLLNDLQNQYKKSVILHLGNINNIPCDNNSFDFVYSISTLYYVSDQENGIKEIYRILKPGGIAYLEFGNKNSLNNFESQRISTGIQSTHILYNQLVEYLENTGFDIFHQRFFQILPLYGNLMSRSLSFVMATPYIKQGYECMLDEAISSSVFLQQYAFRLCMFVSKGFKNIITNPAIQYGTIDDWISKERNQIRDKLIVKSIGNQLQTLCDLFRQDPTDALTFYYMARMHIQTEAERRFVELFKQDLDRYIQQCS